MRDSFGRFIGGIRSSGNYVRVDKACKGCNETKNMLSSSNFCTHKCYQNYRSKNIDKFPKPTFSDIQKINHVIRNKENFKNPEYREKHSKATMEGMKDQIVIKKLHAKREPLTIIHRIRLSNSHIGKRPKNFNGYCVQTKQGWIEFPCGKRYHMLSSWERNIARYFDFLKLKGAITEWLYEPKRFVFENIKFGTRTYLPDFLIKNTDGSEYYVEVKGYMDKKSLTKLKRMKKYFPEIKIRLIQKPEYQEIKKSVGILINEWE